VDLQKFLQAQFSVREATVKVPPALKDYFGDKWRVRALTAAELARANEVSQRTDSIKALVSAMAGNGDKAAAIRESLGLADEEVPADISRRIEMIAAGSVEPKLGFEHRDVAVRLAETFPTFFYELSNSILNLTGSGAEPGKPKRSTRTKASE